LLPRGGANNMRESANGVGKRRQCFPNLSHLSSVLPGHPGLGSRSGSCFEGS
jgi:hypothetical protein